MIFLCKSSNKYAIAICIEYVMKECIQFNFCLEQWYREKKMILTSQPSWDKSMWFIANIQYAIIKYSIYNYCFHCVLSSNGNTNYISISRPCSKLNIWRVFPDVVIHFDLNEIVCNMTQWQNCSFTEIS